MLKAPVAIIGSGPAGYTAAIYTARAGLTPVLYSGANIGGQLVQTPEIENFPGYEERISGSELMDRMKRQAEKWDVKMIWERLVGLEIGSPFFCAGEKTSCEAKSVIIATGSLARWLQVPGEEEFRGYGVSACATCDGFFYRRKTVAVVGGGNSALTDALFLSTYAQKVWIIHRRENFRAEKILQERVFAEPKIETVWDTIVRKIEGTQHPRKMTQIVLENVRTHEQHTLNLDGLFVAIGHDPQTHFLKGKVQLDDHGFIVPKNNPPYTSVPGLFAAGDVIDPRYKQAITAAGFGCMAAIEAGHFLKTYS
jgi:thioredoxin reductase (NADPH)